MSETWLRPNRRALALGMLMPGALLAAGLMLVFADGGTPSMSLVTVAGSLLAGLGLIAIAGLATQMLKPRLAYRDARLAVNLRSGPVELVPIAVVEGFLLGQGPSLLPGRGEKAETTTLVIRLAERADEWSHRPTKPALGTGCDSCITLRGTWCEPLDVALVNRLNHRLVEVRQDNVLQAGAEPVS